MDNYKNHFQKLKNQKTKSPQRPQRPMASSGSHKVSLSYRSNKAKPSSVGSYVLGIICLAGFSAALYAFVYPERLSEISKHVKIGVFAQSEASDKAKSTQDSAAKEEKKSPAEKPKEGAAVVEAKESVPAKPNYIQQLADKEKELDEREKSLAQLEEKLQQEKLELDKRIQALEGTRRDIASRLETRVAQDEENLNKLVGVYSNMNAQNAAQVISKLDDDLAVSVLKRMKKQDAGNILNFIDAEKAKVLSEKYSGY